MLSFRFLEATRDLGLALEIRSLPVLLLLSLLSVSLGCFAGLSLMERSARSQTGARGKWWLGAGTVFGLSLWTMHFLGTLAFQLPIPVGYDVSATLASLLPVVLVAPVVLRFLLRPSLTHIEIILLGALLTAGLAATHQLGISALRLQAEGLYHRQPTWIALGCGFILVTATLYGSRRAWSLVYDLPPLPGRVAAALLGAVGLSSLHFLGMRAIDFFPAASPLPEKVPEMWVLATLISSGAFAMLVVAISIAHFDRRSQGGLAPSYPLMEAFNRLDVGVVLFGKRGEWLVENEGLEQFLGIEGSVPPIGLPPRTGPSSEISGLERLLRGLAAHRKVKIPGDKLDSWIVQQIQALAGPAPPTWSQHLDDDRWIELRISRLEGGGRMAVVSDVTSLRNTEAELGKRERLWEQQSQELQFLHRVCQAATAGHDFRSGLQEVVDLVCQHAGWPEGHVYDVEGEKLKLAPIWYDRSVVRLEQISRLVTRPDGTVGTPLALSILETGEPSLATNEARVQTLRKYVNPEIQQAMGFPVVVRGQVIAIVEFLSDSRRPLSLNRTTLMDLAGQLVRAFELQEPGRSQTRAPEGSKAPPAEVKSRPSPPRDPPEPLFVHSASPESGVDAGSTTPVSESEPPLGHFLHQPQRRLLVLTEESEPYSEMGPMLEEIDWEVTRVGSLEQTLLQLDEHLFDVVLMDLKIQGMDHQKAIAEIRRHDRKGQPRILALTSTWFPDMQARVRGSGFDGFLTKPVQRSELEAILG